MHAWFVRTRTREWWKGEIARWEKSLQSAEEFAKGKGYSSKTLTWWRSAIRRSAQVQREQRTLQVVPVNVVPRTAPLSVWVEIGLVRVEVRAGFDAALLRAVVDALGGAR